MRCCLDSWPPTGQLSTGEKVQWNGMSEKERLMHSVGVKEIFKEELERELKSGAAKIWVDGFTMLVGKLKVENSDFKDLAKQCALGTSG